MIDHRVESRFSRHWVLWQTLLWLGAAAVCLALRWAAIHWFALPDTDDNMRISQVRAWLGGQGWFDLRQYKLNPPVGFDMHWSRVVDLPIAAIELIARQFTDSFTAEKIAAAIAPLLPLWLALVGMGAAARRLIAPDAFIVAGALTLCALSAMLMFMPLRVDHHGWQLTMLVWTMAGLVDRDAMRGGLVMGLTSAISLAIGLELMPFLAIAGGATMLRWVWDDGEAPRLRGYGLMLAAATGLGYLLFASYANRVARCDVLSPVWLATMVLAGALAFAASFLRRRDVPLRIGVTVAIGVIVAGFFASAFPQCLGRPEQISPELYDRWFSHIREAKPLYEQKWTLFANVVAMPVVGVIGSIWAMVTTRRGRHFGNWAPVALVAIVSLALVLWQTRQAPAAQLMAVPGATALIWHFVPRLRAHGSVLVRTLGVVLLFLIGSGQLVAFVTAQLPNGGAASGNGRAAAKDKARNAAIARANAQCPTLPSLRPIAQLPAQTIFTLVDLGPRLITVTHHRAIAGPYHRNGDAILDVQDAFGGTPDAARAIVKRHGATLLLTCPFYNEATIYVARDKNSLEARIERGERIDWLEPVALPAGSPYRLFRVR